MSYEKKPIRVLSGGLNLLLPPDKIDDSEAAELLNLSVDSYGALRSRRGHTKLNNVGAKVVAMIHGLGSVWAAAGGSVYKDGAARIGGLSADRVGLAAYKDHVWAMSEADQRKSDGTNDYDWIPEPPATKPTTKAGAIVETVIDDFSAGWTVDPAGDDSYVGGHLQIFATAENVYSADKAIAKDLETGFSLDDLFKVTVWCKQWAKIRGVTFQLDLNDGTFTKDLVTAQIKAEDIKGGHKEEVTIYIRKRPLPIDRAEVDKLRYTSFTRIGSTPEKGYKTVVAARIKVDFTTTTKFQFRSWSIIGNATAQIEGDDEVIYYTYQTEAGHESNPSPKSDPPLVVNRGSIVVSDLVASPDPQVKFINIYRIGDTLQAVYLVAPNTTTNAAGTYTIINNNDDLTGLNIQLEDDHDAPPAAPGLAGPYFDRLLAFGGGKVYWSHQNKPYAFAGPENIDGDWVGTPDEIGELMQATIYPGFSYLYGTAGVAVLQGDPGGAAGLFRTAQGSGIQSSRGVVQTQRGDFANFSEGIFQFSGSSGENLAKKILPIFKASWNASEAALGFRNDVVWFSDGTRTYLYDLSTQRLFQDSRVFSCFLSDGLGFLGATPSGDILKLETGFTDDGAAIPIAFTSKAYDAGILDNEKTWEDVTIWADTAGSPLSVTAIFNVGQTDQFSVALGTITSGAKERFVLQINGALGVKARNCAVRIAGSVSAEAVIHDIALNWYPEAREGQSFDSDEVDGGTHKVKELLEVYVDLHNPASAQLILQSDQPGFEMATRDSAHSFTASTTRRGDMYTLPTSILGHNHRYLLNGDDLRCYGMRALMQVIGTYLHGSRGEFYRSDPVGFGGELVCLFKEIHVTYAADGLSTIGFETELPNGMILTVPTTPSTLVSTGGLRFRDLQTAKIRLPGTAKGRLASVTITPSGDLRIESLKLFFKAIGAAAATPWTWGDFPVEKTQPAIWQAIENIRPDAVG